MSMDFGPQHQPPPGQGYYSAQPNPPKQPRQGRQGSLDRSMSPRGTEYQYDPSIPPTSRAPPPSDLDAQNQLAPYDEEKAYAEWNRAYGPEPSYIPAPAPVPMPRHGRRHSRRPRRYEDDMNPYEDSLYDPRPRARRSKRRDSFHSQTEDKEKRTKDLAPSLIGSAAGAFLGHKLVSKGPLGAVGGAIAGAVGANAGEHLEGRQRRSKQRGSERRRREDDGYYDRRDDDDLRRSHPRSPLSEASRRDAPPRPRRRYSERSGRERTRSKRYVDSSSEGYASE